MELGAPAKLMLLDTYGLVYAAFFAMKDRPLTTTRGMRIEAITLVEKHGGKSGSWTREAALPA